jgi:NADPH:quinone reductase-like Zn-dependent oxidoreductase
MKAIYFTEHGGVDQLRYGDVPDPELGEHELLIRVRACGVNHADVWVRQGLPFLRVQFPHILGGDIAGEVIAAGAPGQPFAIGTRVVLNYLVSCGRCSLCLAGQDNLCPGMRVLGEELPGGYAELVKVPLENVVPLPAVIDWAAAACVPAVFTTAWNMLFIQAKLQPGEWILIHAAGSGVGSAAIQLAKALGAHHGINYRRQDFLREVRRLTQKRGVDVVIEHIGVEVWEHSLLCLATGGRLVTCGATTGYQAKTDLRHLFGRNLRIFGTKAGPKASLFRVVQLLQEGKLQPVLDRVLPLKEARQAHRLLEARQQFGKLVLVPHG